MKGEPLTTCERSFLLNAIKKGHRIDGRNAYDYRHVQIAFGPTRGHCEARIGETRVLAQATCDLVKPQPSRPTDGILSFNVDLSPMASPRFDVAQTRESSVELVRLLERTIKESRAVDTESLCVVAGAKVWAIRVDVRALNDDGNLCDCCALGAMATLAHFRRPDASVSDDRVTVYAATERPLVPLTVHHVPLCASFAFFDDGRFLLCDPSRLEEGVMDGHVIVAMNKHGEVCCLQMGGGVALHAEQIIRCTKIAMVKVNELVEKIDSALASDEALRSGEKGEEKMDEDAALITHAKKESSAVDPDEVESYTVTTEKEMSSVNDDDDAVQWIGPGTARIGNGHLDPSSGPVLERETDTVTDEVKSKKITEKKQKQQKKKKMRPPAKNSDEEEEEDLEEIVVLTGADFLGSKTNTGTTNVSDSGRTVDLSLAMKRPAEKRKSKRVSRKGSKKNSALK
ncbi:exosome complex component RRP45-like [Oscarella lobularis]|uniref:exosome complex component RRP45-like n=1 Tax=Oscarella lobularis TaxID=121494 RepID=UPI0033130C0C